MKKLLIGLLASASMSSFADCSVSLTQWGANGVHLNDSYVLEQASDFLIKKGYFITITSEGAYNLHVNYHGVFSTSGRSKNVGTTLTLSKLEDDGKVTIASVKNEKNGGNEMRVSKVTLKRNFKDIVKIIPDCY
jgi:hypothetical protein